MDFEVYSIGLCNASVCTSLPLDAATLRLNTTHPTGIRSQWAPTKLLTFKCGTPIGCACPDHPGNKHYLFHC